MISIVNASYHRKCISLSNQKSGFQPTFLNLHLSEYSQECLYYPFTGKFKKCVRSCNTLNDLFSMVCAPYKSEDLYGNVFSMITGINESKT